ncbi:MAG: (d)CMP kinase [Anaerolineae bacterium]|nr:(d)CMP kinase [Anaerolineae bacterium]
MVKPSIIAIDGPSASGKSTLAEQIAQHLGYLYFDTGVMYRAATLAAMQNGIDVHDEEHVSEIAERIVIDVHAPSINDKRKNDVLLDGQDVTWQIIKPEVEANVSYVSKYKRVRDAMTEQQRRIGGRGNVVMVGRDIGTVVFPNADLKIYLDASTEERARRRYEERILRGEKISYQDVLDGMQQRDLVDTSRSIAPLRVAEDARQIKSDGLSIEEVLKQVIDWVEAAG